MDELFSNLVYWHWIAFAVCLAILDVVIGANFFFIWCGLAAAIVGLVHFLVPSISWQLQLLIFGGGVLASLLVWQKFLRKAPKESDKPNLNQRGRQYIGKTFVLEIPIENGRGKIKVDDTHWRVEGPDLPVGTKVKVVAVDGVVLKVDKISE